MRLIYLAILVSITTSIFYFKGGLLLGFFGEWKKPAVSKKAVSYTHLTLPTSDLV